MTTCWFYLCPQSVWKYAVKLLLHVISFPLLTTSAELCYSNFLDTWRSCCTWLLIHCSVPAQWHSFWLSPSRFPPTLSPQHNHYFILLSPFTFTCPLFGVSSLALSCLIQYFSPVCHQVLLSGCNSLETLIAANLLLFCRHLDTFLCMGKGALKLSEKTRLELSTCEGRHDEQSKLHPDLNSCVWVGSRFVLGFKYSERLLKPAQL